MNQLRLLKRFFQILPLSDHARWQITSLLLEPILPLIKGSVVHNAYIREKEWQSKRIRPFHGDTFPELPKQEKPDIFFWGVIDWRFRIQRPQHLARGFSERGHRVFYISTSFVNDGSPGFELEPMDDTGKLYNVRIHLKGRPLIYSAPPKNNEIKRLKASISKLLEWTKSREITSIVQHPYWYEPVRKLSNSRLIYDCLDHHSGFENTGEQIANTELSLIKNADAVVTTSQGLNEFAANYNSNVFMIRNAAEYNFFAPTPRSTYRDTQDRRVLGYYGAIAEWIDIELLAKIAINFPDCLLLLVGADECNAKQHLAHLPNVSFTGEVNYTDLPHYLHGVDICLLPFRVMPLTLATNPVKVYEYLSAGKAVVAIKLPEMIAFEGMIETADNHADFISKLRHTLTTPTNEQLISRRRNFASMNTWSHRVATFEQALQKLPEPLISIIIVTYNNLNLTKTCLDSISNFSDYANHEIIVVDNASSDGSPEYLQNWLRMSTNRHLILNPDNRGFAAANNQGLELANGQYLVLLNNDTEVTPGWLRTLMSHLHFNPNLGIVGPVTNNIGNEARIRLRYSNSDEMRQKARSYTLSHMGEVFPIRTLAFFCVMLPRRVYEEVGPLDEAFGLGFFEDDDYCRRVEQSGWNLACAEDVFIHHHLSASFKKLGKGRQELLEKNRKIYEAKWGPWTPHQRRRGH